MNNRIIKAAQYMLQHGIYYKWGTGANAVSTEVADRQRAYIIKAFGLSNAEFSEAFAYMEQLNREEGEAEAAFFKFHPELNP